MAGVAGNVSPPPSMACQLSFPEMVVIIAEALVCSGATPGNCRASRTVRFSAGAGPASRESEGAGRSAAGEFAVNRSAGGISTDLTSALSKAGGALNGMAWDLACWVVRSTACTRLRNPSKGSDLGGVAAAISRATRASRSAAGLSFDTSLPTADAAIAISGACSGVTGLAVAAGLFAVTGGASASGIPVAAGTVFTAGSSVAKGIVVTSAVAVTAA